MKTIIKLTRNKIFYINPNLVKYCIFPSKHVDYTHISLSKFWPHAGVHRGVFKENLLGFIRIVKSNWDYKPGSLFTHLLEYKALKNHYTGKENWKKSKFAKRNVNFIKMNNSVRGFKDPKTFLIQRERQIDALFESILKKGIYPNDIPREKNVFVDNISLALTKNNKLFFNNRGHHRLSIAKILGLKQIPIKLTLAKSEKTLKYFYTNNK